MANDLARFGAALLEHLLPRLCLGCGVRLGSEGAPLLLCPVCQGQLRPWRPAHHCRTCLRPLPHPQSERPRCLGCLRDPPDFERLLAAWSYAPPLDRVVRSLKFSRLDALAPRLARQAEAWIRWSDLEPVDLLVPVPLPRLRRITRGFNQAELIAAELATRRGATCSASLALRRIWTGPQSRRSARERRERADHEFRVPCPRAVAGRDVLLVDDVVTTGATLRGAAAALHRAGARRIVALAIAATPLRTPGDPVCTA